ncbi:MAG: nickel-dependent hydrogenase large subunit, partial [Crenarchaeota archaeon]|nr:nickel-dependent hydrogenase large subunit [Thermoproteota archaeon]
MGMYVPIGPYHPALKEPITIKIKVEGEKIVDADIELGYNHRGIEKLLESKLWISVPFISEHICGICSGVHQMTAIMGIERIFDIEDKIPERARMLRIVGLELERIHSHLLWLGVAA